MSTPLEVELKQYAHNLVANHVKYEYDRQIGKWQQYINEMVDAQQEALNRHRRALEKVRELIQKEQNDAFGLAMLALSVLGGPALSWVAGKIQYTLFPKFASTVRIRTEKVMLEGPATANLKLLTTTTLDYDKVWAKVYGDLGKQVTGLGIEKGLKVATASSAVARNAVQSVAMSDETSFKTRLENAMLESARLTSDAIMSLAMSINQNSTYGVECLEKLRKENPHARMLQEPDRELENLAKTMIRNNIDERRQIWAGMWFYYGADPGSIAGVSVSIEKEIWALWILEEQLRIDRPLHAARGKTFGIPGVPEPILQRLADFDVVEPRTAQQAIEQGQRRIDELKRRGPVGPAETPEPTTVGSEVDETHEIAALQTWAKNHPALLGAGHLNYRKRHLPSIENIYGAAGARSGW